MLESLKLWIRNPLEVLPSVVVLGLGIGLATTLMSVVYGVLLRPLPFEGAERWLDAEVLRLDAGGARSGGGGVPAPVVARWKQDAKTLSGLSAYSMLMGFGRIAGSPTEAYVVAEVDADFFDLAGARPVAGRGIAAADLEVSAPDVVVLSHSLWQRHFEGDEAVIGAPVTLNGRAATVIGVMPEGFSFPHSQQMWTALRLDPDAWGASLETIVVPSGGVEATRQELEALTRRATAEKEGSPGGSPFQVRLESFVSARADPNLRRMAWPMVWAVFIALGVAGLNVSGLLAARAVGNEHKLAMRSALGAGPNAMMQRAAVEALLVSLVGSFLGLLIAVPAIVAVERLLSRGPLLQGSWAQIRLDPPLVAFALLLGLPIALISGLLPAWKARSVRPSAVMRAGSTGSAGRSSRVADLLVVLEIALAVVLLLPAGLMMQSAWNLSRVDRGFESAGRTTAKVSMLDASSTASPEAFFRRLRQGLLADPDVEGVTFSSSVPTEGTFWADLVTDGLEESFSARWQLVDESYFRVLGVPLLHGRVFDAEQDGAEAPPAAVVSRSFADSFLGASALGSKVRFEGKDRPWLRVVGIVEDTIMDPTPNQDSLATLYVTVGQYPRSSMALIAAGRGREPSAERIRRAVAEADPAAGCFQIRSLDELVKDRRWLTETSAVLFGTFAGAALVLTLAGFYALTAAAVRRRMQELGIRSALGEAPRGLFLRVLRMGLGRVALGLGLGVAVAVPFLHLVRHLVFGVEPESLPNLLAAVVILLGSTFLASLAPAYRAYRADPRTVLRQE